MVYTVDNKVPRTVNKKSDCEDWLGVKLQQP